MRIKVLHETAYQYGGAAKSAVQLLRLTPRNHEGQSVRSWRIELDRPGRLVKRQDCYGNFIHYLFIEGPVHSTTISVIGDVDTQDSAGITRGTVERFPPRLYLRLTELTAPDERIDALAEEIRSGSSGELDRAHKLMLAIRERIAFDVGATTVLTTATQALAAGHGVCQDLTHVFLAVARRLGMPARYVSGYLVQPDSAGDQDASHAWAEAYIHDLGWVSFDAVNGRSATEAYVRVACGLDYLEAAPIRGSHYGGSDESLSVRVRVTDAEQ